MDNLIANIPAVMVARQSITFEAAGVTALNIHIIYQVGSPLKSYVPGRAINSISGFQSGKGYYIIPKQNMDLSAILIPPIPPYPETVEGVVYDYPDTGSAVGLRYAAFPYYDYLADNSDLTSFKLSSIHPAGEKLMIGRSTEGGTNFTWKQLSVAGTPVGGVNLVMSRIGNWIYLARQDDGQVIEISRCPEADFRNNFAGATFTVIDTHDFGAGGYLVGPRAIMQLSNGTYLLPYFFQNSTDGLCGLLKSVDGITFTLGANIYQRIAPGDNTIPVEPVIIETTPGTLVCLIRRYNTSTLGGDSFYHIKSTDYGETWTPSTNLNIINFGSSQGNPIDVIEHGGLIYMVNWNRKEPTPFKIQIITASIADFEANNYTNYSAITELDYLVNASNPPFNVPIDFGYGVLKHDPVGNLVSKFYDISALHTAGDEPNGRRCWIYQNIIAKAV